jgi:putative exosortase-associated protein (TIGR04073 family)
VTKLIQNLTLATLILWSFPPVMAEETYGETVRTKLASGLTNMSFGIAEIPKNMINTSNEANVLLGVTGGVLKGTLHSVGRLLAGAVDFLTFPVPSQPITHPTFVWQEFTKDTSYGPFFDMSRNPRMPNPLNAPVPPVPVASRNPGY